MPAIRVSVVALRGARQDSPDQMSISDIDLTNDSLRTSPRRAFSSDFLQP